MIQHWSHVILHFFTHVSNHRIYTRTHTRTHTLVHIRQHTRPYTQPHTHRYPHAKHTHVRTHPRRQIRKQTFMCIVHDMYAWWYLSGRHYYCNHCDICDTGQRLCMIIWCVDAQWKYQIIIDICLIHIDSSVLPKGGANSDYDLRR